MHPVFHVSQLKKMVGTHTTTTLLPSIILEEADRVPESVLGRKMVKRFDRAATMVLVKWKDQTDEEATWEFLYDLQRKFPNFAT